MRIIYLEEEEQSDHKGPIIEIQPSTREEAFYLGCNYVKPE